MVFEQRFPQNAHSKCINSVKRSINHGRIRRSPLRLTKYRAFKRIINNNNNSKKRLRDRNKSSVKQSAEILIAQWLSEGQPDRTHRHPVSIGHVKILCGYLLNNISMTIASINFNLIDNNDHVNYILEWN